MVCNLLKKIKSFYYIIVIACHSSSQMVHNNWSINVVILIMISVMVQPRPHKILFALGLNKTRTCLFLERTNTPKRLLLIKVWITPYKPNISPVLCRYEIRLGCYIHPSLGTQSTPWGLPHHHSRGHAKLWYHNVMTQPRPDNILSALGLNNARTSLFLRHSYTSKHILSIKV